MFIFVDYAGIYPYSFFDGVFPSHFIYKGSLIQTDWMNSPFSLFALETGVFKKRVEKGWN